MGGSSNGYGGNVRKPCVLIVEDDPHSQYVYEVFLEHKGFRVVSAGTGHEGLRLARELRPDVILMDVSIPGMDGWSATKLLKAEEETAGIPVIAITAHAFSKNREKAREVGCDVFLPKPCHPTQVLAEILQVLDR
jgi:two-component system, cell cycle response regulator DivK